jgi:uncharacterized protein
MGGMTAFRRLSRAFPGTAVFVLFLSCLLAGGQATQNKPAERGSRILTSGEAGNAGRRYVAVIGVNHYANWPILSTAVNDATGFATLLQQRFGYESAAPPLIEKLATRSNIESLIARDLPGKVAREDDLILFFAGHGTIRTDASGEQTSYIVPYDAEAPGRDERWNDYIEVKDLLRQVSGLPAKHILVILDSCHSGFALGQMLRVPRSAGERLTEDLERRVSRKVIASAAGDETAADQGPVPNHSLFTGLMIQGLETGKADVYGDGAVTGSQLGQFVQHAVSTTEGAKQTPVFGAFYLDETGELILSKGGLLANVRIAPSRSEDLTADRSAPRQNLPTPAESLSRTMPGASRMDVSYNQGTILFNQRRFLEALPFLSQACSRGVTDACNSVGFMYQNGFGVTREYEHAKTYYEQACTSTASVGCSNLGSLYRDQLGVSQDYARAASLFSQGCDGGIVEGCDNLGRMYLDGTGVARDYPRALALFTRGCGAGYGSSCGNLGFLYIKGLGVTRDPPRAASFFLKACEMGSKNSCNSLGTLYRLGEGVPKDLQKAFEYYSRTCRMGGEEGCEFAQRVRLLETGAGMPATPDAPVRQPQATPMGGRPGGPQGSENPGVFVDRQTGLVWTAKDSGVAMGWKSAFAYCSGLHIGGHTDWRLPRIEELHSLYDASGRNLPECKDVGGGPLQYPIRVRSEITLGCYWIWSSDQGHQVRMTGGPVSTIRIFNFYNGLPGESFEDNKEDRTLCVRGSSAVR